MSDEQCSSSGDSDDDYHTCDEDEDEDEKSDVPRAASPSSSSSEDGRDPSYYYHTSDDDEDEDLKSTVPPKDPHNEDARRKEREDLDVLGAAPVVAVRTETRQLHTRSVTGLEQCVQKMLQSCEQPNTQLVPSGSQQAEETLAVASGTDLRDIDQNVQGLLQPQRRRQFDSWKSQVGDDLAVTIPDSRQFVHTTAQDEDTVALATGNVSTGRHAGTLVQLNVSLTQQQFGDVTVENATNVNQSFGGNQNISKTIDDERREPPPSRAASINKRTVSLAHCWNEGMVKTAALTRALDKLDGGGRWLTIKGNPGEGKTTVGYMVLEELHRCGRQVYEVRSPDEFSEVISTCPRPVIMLDDVFGNLEFDQAKWSNWESVVSPLLKEREHKSHDQNNDTHFKDVTVILIGRDYVLNSASVDLGRLSHFLTSDKYVVCMDHTLQRDIEEKRAIWNSLSSSSGVKLNTKIVERILRCKGPHGFPHVCRLFITIFKESKVVDAEEFFRKPLEFLNLSMSKLFKDKNKLQLFKVMLRSGGEASMRRLRESDPTYTLIESCKSLVGSYLRIEEDSFVFDHPSIFDSVAYHMCSIDPVFVIEQCELSFIHERVRLQSFNDKTPNPETKLVVYIDKAYEDDLAKRFAVEISAHNFVYVLSHQAFTDRSFVNRVMSKISRPLTSLLHMFDRSFPYNMEKSFLALLTSNTSPELLKYVDDRLELTQDEVDTVLYAACKYAASAVLTYLTDTKESVDIDVKFHEAMTTPLMIAAMTRDVQFVNHVLSLKPGLNATQSTCVDMDLLQL